MAKNRFSNQKPINYSSEFKFGNFSTIGIRIEKPKLDEERRAYLCLLLSCKLNEWENSFIRNMLNQNVSLSDKQNQKVREIAKRFYGKK